MDFVEVNTAVTRSFLRTFLAGALISLFAVPRLSRAAELPIDAPLPQGAQATGEANRYRSPRGFDETLDFYRRLFHQTGGVRWRFIVNQPGLRARHVASLRQRTKWSGINISDHQGDVVIYVLSREANTAPPGAPTP